MLSIVVICFISVACSSASSDAQPTETTSADSDAERSNATTGGLSIVEGVPDGDGLSQVQELAGDLGLTCDRLPDKPAIDLAATDEISTTEMLDVRSEQVQTLADVVDGSRPVLLWFWQPCNETTERAYEDFTALAHEHRAVFQSVGIGGGGDYAGVALLSSQHDDAVTMLWDDGNAWSLFDQFPTASTMLLTHDLEGQSTIMPLNPTSVDLILTVAVQEPWVSAED